MLANRFLLLSGALILLSSVIGTSIYSVSAWELAPRPTAGDHGNRKLASRLTDAQSQRSEVFKRALLVLNSLESASSCHKLAAMSLMGACESLEKSSKSEVTLEETQEKYAVRLAMCELTGAHAPYPPQCEDFVPAPCSQPGAYRFPWNSRTREATASHQTCYPDTTRQQMKQCLSLLHSKSQWWTSYSNAAQNAVLVCQATRSALDKEEILKVLRSGARMSDEMISLVEVHLNLARDFVEALKGLQDEVLREQRAQMDQTKTFLGNLRLMMQQSFHGFMDTVVQGANDVATRMEMLERNVDQTDAKMQHADSMVETLIEQADRGTALTTSHINELEVANRHIWNITAALDQVQVSSMAELGDSLELAIQRLLNFSDSMTNVEVRIDRNNEKLELQADTIDRMNSSNGIGTAFLAFPLAVLLTALFPAFARYVALLSVLTWLAIHTYTELLRGAGASFSSIRLLFVSLQLSRNTSFIITCGLFLGLSLVCYVGVYFVNWYRKGWANRTVHLP